MNSVSLMWNIITRKQMKIYNEQWHKCGDVREWEKRGLPVRVYRKIKARELWNLINICATYSAEPGIFFIDNANEITECESIRTKSRRDESMRRTTACAIFGLQSSSRRIWRNMVGQRKKPSTLKN